MLLLVTRMVPGPQGQLALLGARLPLRAGQHEQRQRGTGQGPDYHGVIGGTA